MDKHGEGPYLEVKMPEGFLLQFRLDHGVGWTYRLLPLPMLEGAD